MRKRPKAKLVLVTAVLLLSGALVASTGVAAQAALQACTTSNGYTLTPSLDGGGNWPIPTTSTSGNVPLYEWRYNISPPPTSLQNIQVSLNKQTKLVKKSDGVTPDDYNGTTGLRPVCVGGISNNILGQGICDVRVYVWTAVNTKVSTRSFYTARNSNESTDAHGPVGGCSVKQSTNGSIGYGTGVNSTLEVPIPAPPTFASVLLSEVIKVDGVPYCIPLGPNGCPSGDPPFLCSDTNHTPLPRENLTFVDSNNNTHVPIWFQGTAENPACTRGQFFVNPTCHYIYIGGTPYKVC